MTVQTCADLVLQIGLVLTGFGWFFGRKIGFGRFGFATDFFVLVLVDLVFDFA